ncbi:hypothetical protein B4119_3929 [Parageobacillus caldoxylosilyticus]|uniref:Uncharacterized protein n=1 Tax=Saccharococcus caldoxylosilyticus TaxID=81408 RepID=A0A150M4R8_9BACL|nr:hypothetical protein B4119_3929 [Parageobacillus caldoxylosilyticus]
MERILLPAEEMKQTKNEWHRLASLPLKNPMLDARYYENALK